MIDLPTTLHAPAPVWTPGFDIPSGVIEIDLDEDPRIAAERLSGQARTVFPGLTDEQLSRLVESRPTVVDALRAAGVYWAGFCLARGDADPSRLTIAHLAASIVDGGTDDVDLAAALTDLNGGGGILAGQGLSQGERVADVIRLPAGKAILVLSEQLVRPPGTAFGAPHSAEHRVRQVLVAVPVPDTSRLMLLTLATAHLDDWPAYLDLMATIARSLRFTCD